MDHHRIAATLQRKTADLATFEHQISAYIGTELLAGFQRIDDQLIAIAFGGADGAKLRIECIRKDESILQRSRSDQNRAAATRPSYDRDSESATGVELHLVFDANTATDNDRRVAGSPRAKRSRAAGFCDGQRGKISVKLVDDVAHFPDKWTQRAAPKI